MCYQKEETKYYIHNVLLFGVIQERKRKLIISDRNTVLYIGMIELDLGTIPCQVDIFYSRPSYPLQKL